MGNTVTKEQFDYDCLLENVKPEQSSLLPLVPPVTIIVFWVAAAYANVGILVSWLLFLVVGGFRLYFDNKNSVYSLLLAVKENKRGELLEKAHQNFLGARETVTKEDIRILSNNSNFRALVLEMI